MKGIKRSFALGASAIAAAALAAPAIAWACSGAPQNYIVATPSSGVAGSAAQISGYGFDPSNGPVSIYWINSDGSDGPLLGTAQGPSFDRQVVIPSNATPNTYTIQTRQKGLAGGWQAYYDKAPYTVTQPSSAQPATVGGSTAPASHPTGSQAGSGQGTSANPNSKTYSGSLAPPQYLTVPAPGAAAPVGASAGGGGGGSTVYITGPNGTTSVPVPTVPGAAPVAAPVADGSSAPSVLQDVRHDVWPASKGTALTSSPQGDGFQGGVVLLIAGAVVMVGGFALLQVRRRMYAGGGITE